MAKKSNSLYEITPLLLGRVEYLARKGLQNNQIAAELGWSEATFYKRKAASTEFAEAVKRGEAFNIQEVVNALARRAKGYNYEETHVEEGNGPRGPIEKTKILKKHIAPDVSACIFILVNRDPENWQNKSKQIIEGAVPVEVGGISKRDAKKVKDIFDEITK